MEITITRRCLPVLLRTAAEAQGKNLVLSPDPTHLGRLGYRIDDGEWGTPGETAQKLGVVWP